VLNKVKGVLKVVQMQSGKYPESNQGILKFI